ncbi:MAG TPA: ATP-binding cassette domain-containing protein, partial [Patescibacteria group bacterium]|nr:ATP-binding cassette domain-containing protein [Patescibacteria group bacterium]
AQKNEQTLRRIHELRSRLQQLFQIEEFTDRQVKELSGGERTKLSLCLLLMSEPDVLLLDEPTNHLDLESIAKLGGLLESYAAADISVLSVSHVHSYLAQAGRDGVAEIRLEPGARTLAFSSRPYLQFVRDRSRQDFSIVDGTIAWAVPQGKPVGIILSPLKEKITIPQSPLESIEVPPLVSGAVWVLSGNNGCGKTKLMESMVRQKKGEKNFERSKGAFIAYLPQFWPDEVAEGSLEQFYRWVVNSIDQFAQVVPKQFIAAIQKIGFTSHTGGKSLGETFLRKPLASFSGGEQRLLWFLAASTFKPKLDALFLDEPTNHMDHRIQEVVTKAIQDFPGAVVFSTHDLNLLESISATGGVGNTKGGTMSAKNFILEKRGGRTRIIESTESPALYMRRKMESGHKVGKRAGTKV